MAIREHPYYGSFGYHVSSFYAASSRFGTPDDLKRLIDDAHQRGIAVIMDIVHSHAVKTKWKGWADSMVLMTCISMVTGDANIRHGIRFALITAKTPSFISCCRTASSGLRNTNSTGSASTESHQCCITTTVWERLSGSYDDYYDGNEDINAIVYLSLANILIHEINPKAITIAEEMSGMPSRREV